MWSRPAGIDEFTGDPKEIINTPLFNQPGSMWEYSTGIDWAGIVLERATGLKLNDYFQKHIFEPLGITDATMFPTKAMKSNIAYMHQRDTGGEVRERDHVYRRALLVETKEEEERFLHSGGAGLFGKPKEYISEFYTPLFSVTLYASGVELKKIVKHILTRCYRNPRRPPKRRHFPH